MPKILVSSDHHANWEALEHIYFYAKDHKLPFVINGDVIGDYNFTDLAEELKLQFPYEITQEKLMTELDENELKKYHLYSQVSQFGEEDVLKQLPDELQEKAKTSIKKAIELIESNEFQIKVQMLQKRLHVKFGDVISEHKIKLQALYKIIVRTHAKKLATVIDKTQVQTYFLAGNHEPAHFVQIVQEYLTNKELIVDLAKTTGVSDVNGIKIAGVSNVAALMPFLSDLYEDNELDSLFSHQQGVARPILFKNVDAKILQEKKHELASDIDWNRIMPTGETPIDVFFTHGQIGVGAWRDSKKCPETPTLLVAAMLSHLSQVTVDAHLHTSHEMINEVGTPTIRGVGNVAYVLTKNPEGKITYEKQEFDIPYKAKSGVPRKELDLYEILISDLVWK